MESVSLCCVWPVFSRDSADVAAKKRDGSDNRQKEPFTKMVCKAF